MSNLNIKADITFIVKQKEKPVYDSSAITGMIPKLYFSVEKKSVNIKDIRQLKKCSLNKNGFELLKFSSIYNIENISENLERYKKEIYFFLKKKYNFKKIFIFDTTKRSNRKDGAPNNDGRRQPADRAHVDYTEKSGPVRAKDVIGDLLYNKTLEKGQRIIQMNLWKPLCKKILSSPLAFADPKSVQPKDLVATDQRFPNRIGEIYHLAYNQKQLWYWVPNMTENEVLLLKGWDSSNKKNVVKYTPHTSFNLSKQNIKKNPRDSIEARIFMIL